MHPAKTWKAKEITPTPSIVETCRDFYYAFGDQAVFRHIRKVFVFADETGHVPDGPDQGTGDVTKCIHVFVDVRLEASFGAFPPARIGLSQRISLSHWAKWIACVILIGVFTC
jgi:hypothetical protein